ncbi:MAG: HAD family hydrolase [Desulfobacteraceae bacterium]|jgi:phosphoglycolate phosphatase
MTKSSNNAIIFDLDGTLLDTLDELGIITNIVLEKNGFPTHSLDEYRYLVGEGAENLITRALGNEGSNRETVQRCLSEFLTIYRATCGERSRLYDGVPQLLDDLVHMGIRLAVLSNKPHDLTLKNIDLFLPHIPFDLVLGQRDGVPKKPDPHGALEIADHMGIKPENFLYIGDTSIDMRTAVAAGMNPVGVLWGFRGEEELRSSGAKHIIEKPGEILGLLQTY